MEWYPLYETKAELEQLYGSEWAFRFDINAKPAMCCYECLGTSGTYWTKCSHPNCYVVLFRDVTAKYAKKLRCTNGLCLKAVCFHHKFENICAACGTGVCKGCSNLKECSGKGCNKILCGRHDTESRCGSCVMRNYFDFCHGCASCESKQYFQCPICWATFCPTSRKRHVIQCHKCKIPTCESCCVIVNNKKTVFCRKCVTQKF